MNPALPHHYSDGYTNSPLAQVLIKNFFSSLRQVTLPHAPQVNSVLEVGCGEGESTRFLTTYFSKTSKYFASDIDLGAIKLARKKNPHVKFKTSESIYQLNRRNHSFDLVIALEVLEHLQNPKLALTELERVSKKYLLLSVPHEPFWSLLNLARGKYLGSLGNTPGHLNRWTYFSWKKLLSNHFDIITIQTPLPWLVTLCQKKPI